MEKRLKINNSEDFIDAAEYGNSLEKLLEKYHSGVPDKTAANVLNLTIKEYNKIHICAIMKLRKYLKVPEGTESEQELDNEQ